MATIERRARSFGDQAAAYARHRPSYAVEALRWALASARLTASSTVVDIAAGTGILTAQLLDLPGTVIAVEPDAKMRSELCATLPCVAARDGLAEDTGLPSDSADAVTVGQGLHWFDFSRALRETARVLRPAGVLAALWNHEDVSVPWVAEFVSLARTANMSRQQWANPAVALPQHPDFEPFDRQQFPHRQRRTSESLISTVMTQSHMLTATSEERQAMRDLLRELLASYRETERGDFDLPLVTTAIRANLSQAAQSKPSRVPRQRLHPTEHETSVARLL